MLTRRILSPLSVATLFTLVRLPCSQIKLDFFGSNYHVQGPTHFKRTRTIEKLLGGRLAAIEALQSKLDPLRSKVISSSSAPQVEQYVNLYEKLREAVSACQINNEWVYNVISWYNMTPFYSDLLRRLLTADPQQLPDLILALHAMHRQGHHPRVQELFKEPQLAKFYKQLDKKLEVGLLRKLEEVLQTPLNYSKRWYYQKYLPQNLEIMLKSLNAADASQVSDLIWLFEATIKAMSDDEILISKIEKIILTMRLSLSTEDLERLISAYQLKGRISPIIYQEYLRPYIINHKFKDFNDVVRCLKFLICSQAEDQKLLKQLYDRLNQMNSISLLTPEMAKTLHFYTHYLRIKGARFLLSYKRQTELINQCRNDNRERSNSMTRIVADRDRRQGNGKKMFNYASQCTYPKKSKMEDVKNVDLSTFEEDYRFQLGSVDFKATTIYKEAHFCCINMEYCIHKKTTNQIINMQSECVQYAFNSGRLSREMEIRDEILAHYGIKATHINLKKYKKGKGKMSEEEVLINRRVVSIRY